MRLLHSSILAILISGSTLAQPLIQRDLIPARGHYKELARFSTSPGIGGETVDQLKFQSDSATIKRRLSIKPVYLKTVTTSDFKIPDLPTNSSDQTRAEINYLLGLQQQRTADEERASLYKANVYYNLRVTPSDSAWSNYRRNLFYIGRSMGTWFNPKDLPVTADLMANVWRDASYFIWTFKYKYARIRPYVIDESLSNLEETNWPAYPSGHAANSYINAFIYSELAPEFEDVFIKDALDMAHSREIIGVHYPSDSEASRIFARQFVNFLFQNEAFLNDFNAAKQEWASKARESFAKPSPSDEKSKVKKEACSSTCDN
jgi:acid phosphatase (class A)